MNTNPISQTLSSQIISLNTPVKKKKKTDSSASRPMKKPQSPKRLNPPKTKSLTPSTNSSTTMTWYRSLQYSTD